ncbi:ATP-binding cassette domain-containing protein [Peptoniphilus lacrimalis]|uniref:ABC transporter, ATP-binding protein n=1 Tax=Peptoniphilus lacrimalis 315-B TaxID=596330 RepID=D1VS46_9FIRM|nr:ATP-binding cassette domain-containing protein [Peptoniphilus lacrimalis]EFA90634.1 ABC transporter, ATP-binding protein [Peptoniphilus lacrimalis 315-B]
MKISEILEKYPFAQAYFENNKLDIEGKEAEDFDYFLKNISDEKLEELATDRKALKDGLKSFIDSMMEFLSDNQIQSITILPGKDKDGNKENFEELVLKKSDVFSIVGPTGAGKSRLLSDIDWLAQGDTPTGRKILVNGQKPNSTMRFSTQDKIVAELSQNMNFVMDLTVREFIELHSKSRLIDPKEKIKKIIEDANNLAGEKFSLDTNITELSGGQSRALMISDTANLSKSPIVLIDEIENAGIDRKKAVELLMSQDKIVIISTHDPSLALMADKRIVIKNGGIYKIIETSENERKILNKLEGIDEYLETLRNNLRNGQKING